MRPIALVIAALVFPLVWGYLSEQILRRIWPRRSNASNADAQGASGKHEPPTPFLDYQI